MSLTAGAGTRCMSLLPDSPTLVYFISLDELEVRVIRKKMRPLVNRNAINISLSYLWKCRLGLSEKEKERPGERHRLENIAKDRKVIPESPVSQRTLKEKIKPWEKREKYAWKQ